MQRLTRSAGATAIVALFLMATSGAEAARVDKLEFGNGGYYDGRVVVDRNALDQLTFKDKENALVTLSQLLAGANALTTVAADTRYRQQSDTSFSTGIVITSGQLVNPTGGVSSYNTVGNKEILFSANGWFDQIANAWRVISLSNPGWWVDLSAHQTPVNDNFTIFHRAANAPAGSWTRYFTVQTDADVQLKQDADLLLSGDADIRTADDLVAASATIARQVATSRLDLSTSTLDGTFGTTEAMLQGRPGRVWRADGRLQAPSLHVGPDYAPNAGTDWCGTYDGIATATASNLAPHREMFFWGNKYAIRQTGDLTHVQLYVTTTTGLASLKVRFWRRDDNVEGQVGPADLVGETGELASSVTARASNLIALAAPVAVREGDFYSIRLAATTGVLVARTGQSNVYMYYVDGDDPQPTPTAYTWNITSGTNGTVVPVRFFMQAPTFVVIGDSIMAGRPAHDGYCIGGYTADVDSHVAHFIGRALGGSYQNMGIGGNTTTMIRNRYASDVVALRPRFAVMEGGVNDANTGVSTATFLANWEYMLQQNRANGIDSIVLLVLPWTSGTTTQMRTIDSWNAALKALAYRYGAIVVDAATYVGEHRPGGDPGNLWNIRAPYNADGVHFTPAGHERIAQAIVDALGNGGVAIKGAAQIGGDFQVDGLASLSTTTLAGPLRANDNGTSGAFIYAELPAFLIAEAMSSNESVGADGSVGGSSYATAFLRFRLPLPHRQYGAKVVLDRLVIEAANVDAGNPIEWIRLYRDGLPIAASGPHTSGTAFQILNQDIRLADESTYHIEIKTTNTDGSADMAIRKVVLHGHHE